MPHQEQFTGSDAIYHTKYTVPNYNLIAVFEEQLATVTVVEDFDPSTLIHGPPTDTSPEDVPAGTTTPAPTSAAAKAPASKLSSSAAKKKVRPKDIKYETKAARKTARAKQHARKTEKAERAGGKASRRKGERGNGSSGKGKRR